MNDGTYVFSQLMGLIHRQTFARIVEKYGEYLNQSTGAAGNTTFMKLTDEWIKANDYKGKW